MNYRKKLHSIRSRRGNRVKAQIKGNAQRPRLSVARSNYYTSVQLIDDVAGKTLASASTMTIDQKGSKSNHAAIIGKAIAEKAISLGVKEVVFDRGRYRYHGRIKALADAAREAGLVI